MGGSRGEPESEAAVTVAWKPHSRVGGHGHRRAERMESSKRHLGRRGAGSAAVSPGASSWPTRTASGARAPGRNRQMFQLLLSHLTVDGRGVPDSVNGFLTIPLGTGGRAPELREGRGWGFHTGIARCAPRGGCRHSPRTDPNTNPKRQRLPGKLLPVRICNSEESPSFPEVAASLHVSFTAGAFPAGSEAGPGGRIAIQTA